jgi:IS4 transposase
MQGFTRWNRSRCQCLAHIVCAAIAARSVKLDDLATQIPGKAKFASKTRRLQYFFRDFDLDYSRIALLVVSILGTLLDRQWLLAIDRTNWERRGNPVNLLTLAVCLGDVAIPLFWIDLRHKGNSDTQQRIALVRRFLKVFGKDRILAVTGDREFVGKNWFRWLKKREIPFVLRIRDNFMVPTACGRTTHVWNCFRNLRLYEQKVLGERKVGGVRLLICGIRLPANEYVILVSAGVAPQAGFDLYRRRWQIETLFEKLKSHGFDLEGSRLRGKDKADKLLAALALAAAWCYAFGRWHVEAVAPLKWKAHGRREKAVFRRGLDLLRQAMNGCAAELARFCRKAYSLFCPSPHLSALNLL